MLYGSGSVEITPSAIYPLKGGPLGASAPPIVTNKTFNQADNRLRGWTLNIEGSLDGNLNIQFSCQDRGRCVRLGKGHSVGYECGGHHGAASLGDEE